MYTNEMAQAFRSLDHYCPKGFSVQLIDHEHFITVKADEKQFNRLVDFDKRRAVQYMILVKKALEENGAIVLLVREGIE